MKVRSGQLKVIVAQSIKIGIHGQSFGKLVLESSMRYAVSIDSKLVVKVKILTRRIHFYLQCINQIEIMLSCCRELREHRLMILCWTR